MKARRSLLLLLLPLAVPIGFMGGPIVSHLPEFLHPSTKVIQVELPRVT